mmetsp:Transcript_14906/g.48655  ORF Transcript_14906/g.48655 Transcript_14906/m.48655 type:complete len:341 (+) Transcript_14906:5405-6427(+)
MQEASSVCRSLSALALAERRRLGRGRFGRHGDGLEARGEGSDDGVELGVESFGVYLCVEVVDLVLGVVGDFGEVVEGDDGLSLEGGVGGGGVEDLAVALEEGVGDHVDVPWSHGVGRLLVLDDHLEEALEGLGDEGDVLEDELPMALLVVVVPVVVVVGAVGGPFGAVGFRVGGVGVGGRLVVEVDEGVVVVEEVGGLFRVGGHLEDLVVGGGDGEDLVFELALPPRVQGRFQLAAVFVGRRPEDVLEEFQDVGRRHRVDGLDRRPLLVVDVAREHLLHGEVRPEEGRPLLRADARRPVAAGAAEEPTAPKGEARPRGDEAEDRLVLLLEARFPPEEAVA